jgi:hypothetical protein
MEWGKPGFILIVTGILSFPTSFGPGAPASELPDGIYNHSGAERGRERKKENSQEELSRLSPEGFEAKSLLFGSPRPRLNCLRFHGARCTLKG